MSWIANLPVGILYCIVGLFVLIICGFLGLFFVTILRGGKIKAAGVEIDGEPDEPKSDLTPK